MKRADLIRELEQVGCVLLRHGARHDIFHQPQTGRTQPVPRHREINEILAKKIIRDLTI
ncbi:type II toxin-antitoxin system HicA family toxin [Synechococcus sp. CS-1331]|uniref:type II toxin-antitoxin system HicA family toxin n=1 Tax=Synechococcus sp. CS-1331 TaxID=2847973 RepID=UPI0019BCBD61|nr:type II toxin-antitoxin system HicA family toxin [Synechococcus sp. CS-1331]MCT0228373.1 type II toxin-antitoxin system HicA family toxin [Synechococcus sp. CS-1331]NQW38692.1 type II toxin-antitoxin system HicA family toxin [Cyanobacteria bacterium bin.275]